MRSINQAGQSGYQHIAPTGLSGPDSGRANRGGFKAKTRGCIRTTDAGTAYLKQLSVVDPITAIVVSHDGSALPAPAVELLV